MSLRLTHKPAVVAAQDPSGGWTWYIEADAQETLRMAMAHGSAGTAQRRGSDGRMLLLAWDVGAQKAHAEEAAQDRATQEAAKLYTHRDGAAPRVYKPPGRSVAMRTHAPYAHEPARW